MASPALSDELESVEALDGVALKLAGAVSNAVPVGAPRDALSGTWLGHARHPLLTDVVIGSFISASRHQDRARRAGEGRPHRLGEHTAACDSVWGLGIHARSRALLSDGEAAERLYREAVDRLERARLRPDLARAQLLTGSGSAAAVGARMPASSFVLA